MCNFLLLFALGLGISSATLLPLSPSLSQALESKGSASVFLVLQETTAPVLASLQRQSFQNRGERLTSVANALKDHAAKSQRPLLEFLSKTQGIVYESFWINNQVYIQDADSVLLDKLRVFPGIVAIKEEMSIPLDKLVHTPTQSSGVFAEAGVEKVQAHLVWNMSGGTRGEGIILGEMTTGVRGTHEALRDNYVGEYGWLDPVLATGEPNDPVGRGTFSTGLLVGSGGIGVAPGAKWMACRGCAEFSCMQVDLLRCGEFMACPTTPGGGSPDCTKAPHIVVNNWSGGGPVWYEEVVDAWHAAGITPVFVNGINGPDCGTAGASENVVAVGAVDFNDEVSQGSSRGPSAQGKIMPDIVAPGVGIRSAYNTNDTAYTTLSSTTAATGIASGVIALLRSSTPELSFQEIREFLYIGADTADLVPTGGDCGGIPETQVPNNAYGYGRVNAYKSVLAAASLKH